MARKQNDQNKNWAKQIQVCGFLLTEIVRHLNKVSIKIEGETKSGEWWRREEGSVVGEGGREALIPQWRRIKGKNGTYDRNQTRFLTSSISNKRTSLANKPGSIFIKGIKHILLLESKTPSLLLELLPHPTLLQQIYIRITKLNLYFTQVKNCSQILNEGKKFCLQGKAESRKIIWAFLYLISFWEASIPNECKK